MEVNGIVINPQSGSAGTHDISVSIATVNEDLDKEVYVEAICGNKSDQLKVIHEGMREILYATDGELYDSTGVILKALK